MAVFFAVIVGLLLAGQASTSLAEAEPEVKKSRSDICHDRDSVHYERTKKYAPYESMEACLASGGRESLASPRIPLWQKIAAVAILVLLILGGWFWLRRPPPGPGPKLDELERHRWHGHRRR